MREQLQIMPTYTLMVCRSLAGKTVGCDHFIVRWIYTMIVRPIITYEESAMTSLHMHNRSNANKSHIIITSNTGACTTVSSQDRTRFGKSIKMDVQFNRSFTIRRHWEDLLTDILTENWKRLDRCEHNLLHRAKLHCVAYKLFQNNWGRARVGNSKQYLLLDNIHAFFRQTFFLFE